MGTIHAPDKKYVATGRHKDRRPRQGIKGPRTKHAHESGLRSDDSVSQNATGRQNHQRARA
jgi:hypothetical protein